MLRVGEGLQQEGGKQKRQEREFPNPALRLWGFRAEGENPDVGCSACPVLDPSQRRHPPHYLWSLGCGKEHRPWVTVSEMESQLPT